MRVQGARSRDAESRPTREPGGISGGYREATIFPPGAWIVKEAAASLLNTFTGAGAPDKLRT
ncbi:hypothetical protein CI104_08390 [Citrobacter farmeri]|uniref:Uncharacterized protein n=1 Tax=Citrobacter farmeri TaxID=67824 RepID=A0ACA8D4P4_9ENTR|nr:hypothetical protein CI104_08390 [Citrobacter farmeri]